MEVKKKVITINIDSHLLQMIDEKARAEGRSRSNMICQIVDVALTHEALGRWDTEYGTNNKNITRC